MADNCIPYIAGEEEKSEQEPLKLWGRVENGVIVPAKTPQITRSACASPARTATWRPCSRASSKNRRPSRSKSWANFRGPAQELALPSAPRQFLHYFEQPDRPQTKLDRMLENGMAVSIGRLRPDTQYDYKFVCASRTIRCGALRAAALLLAELLAAKGYLD